MKKINSFSQSRTAKPCANTLVALAALIFVHQKILSCIHAGLNHARYSSCHTTFEFRDLQILVLTIQCESWDLTLQTKGLLCIFQHFAETDVFEADKTPGLVVHFYEVDIVSNSIKPYSCTAKDLSSRSFKYFMLVVIPSKNVHHEDVEFYKKQLQGFNDESLNFHSDDKTLELENGNFFAVFEKNERQYKGSRTGS